MKVGLMRQWHSCFSRLGPFSLHVSNERHNSEVWSQILTFRSYCPRLITDNFKDLRASLRRLRGVKYWLQALPVAAFCISILIVVSVLLPASTRAGLFNSILVAVKGGGEKTANDALRGNLQTMSLLKPAMNISPTPARGGGDISIVDDIALVPQEGPSGTIADIEKPKNSTISLYTVREGDTLSRIAQMFEVSINTIRWANDIPLRDTIRPGQVLTILPVTGVRYTVKSGDTLSSLAKRFDGDAEEIARFNGFADESSLAVGAEIIIPDGEIAIAVASPSPRPTSSTGAPTPTYAGYYMRPITGGVKTQGIHGYNGVDLAAPAGTPIVASSAGDVIVVRNSGWNGGYGVYVVIRHDNDTQTLYAHNSSNIVSVGQRVVQGQTIGYVGSTGRSTGAHVHFEIRNGPRNPF
ncbi:MAG: Lipoprotein [Parcubacteria group bacterium GW2011_GWA1_53_13]|nr:MAG: Lipoprotein [Parcubacteria group bacterium GW2011_GWA1_53_13]